jgi:hypothetical protein
VRLLRAYEVDEGEFLSVMGAWYEVRRIVPTLHTPAKLAFTFENNRTIIYNPDDLVLILDL